MADTFVERVTGQTTAELARELTLGGPEHTSLRRLLATPATSRLVDGLTGLCESCNHAKQAAAGTPGFDQDDDTRWRPPPLPATPTGPGATANLASSTSTGHDRLDLVLGAPLRFAA